MHDIASRIFAGLRGSRWSLSKKASPEEVPDEKHEWRPHPRLPQHRRMDLRACVVAPTRPSWRAEGCGDVIRERGRLHEAFFRAGRPDFVVGKRSALMKAWTGRGEQAFRVTSSHVRGCTWMVLAVAPRSSRISSWSRQWHASPIMRTDERLVEDERRGIRL